MPSIKHRQLSRSSSHRQALLRNLVTSLISQEYISTTLAKAKEVQRIADKVITLGKKNTEATRTRAQSIFFEPHKYLPKLFGPLAQRYKDRQGGYTRLLRTESLKDDTAPSAILTLADGPRDMLFSMTAKAVLREKRKLRLANLRPITAVNVRKVTRFRENGDDELEAEVQRLAEEERRVEGQEEADFATRGVRREWVESPGPGKMRKRKVNGFS